MPLSLPIRADFRKLLAFGLGVGIQIGDQDLQIAVARVRPSGVRVSGRLTVENFSSRPAAEWGREYTGFLKRLGSSYLAATVLLPRREVIVRQLALPGVASADIEAAIRFQIDSLHPYGDEEVCWGWSPLGDGAVLIGIVRRSDLERYVQVFVEAGIAVASFTFSAAAVHAALRLDGAAEAHATGFVALSQAANGAVEVYGESPSHPVYSAEFDLPPERAAILAASELRLAPDTAVLKLEEVLPHPRVNPVENDLSRNALPYATALAGACPWLASAANLLPVEFRKSASRAILVPTAILGVALLSCAGGMWGYSRYQDTQYARRLDAEIAKLEPAARHATALDAQIDRTRARAAMLDEFRSHTRADLEALHELTKRVEPPAWTSSLDLQRDSARLMGEAPQAVLLVKILDSSTLFENSAADSIQKAGAIEQFTLHTGRRGHK
jgi:hypothetical protein